ncbi:hypothetical protein WJX74_009791 [Apatococcus lobatus]|uniref:Nuclear pore complex protein Nup85 n=1 Tax=Apatococcus lobatus TaxID=904363 RepID=A0AAW1RL82_9CHLO
MQRHELLEEEEEELQCFSDSLLRGRFRLGSRLDVVAAPVSSEDPALEFQLHWNRPASCRRALIHNSLPVFKDLQKTPVSERSLQDIMMYSEAMKMVLFVETPRIQEGTEPSVGQFQAREILDERALWALTEILFLQPGCSAGTISEALAAWLDQNDYVLASPGWSVATSMARFMEQHEMGRMPEASSDYWGTMQRLVALGRIDEALKLLGLHSAWEQEFTLDNKSIAVQTTCLRAAGQDLLRGMPRLHADIPPGCAGEALDSEPDFNLQRQQWLAACNGALDDDPFWDALHEASASTARGLRGMLEVMVGSQEALQGATVGWLELVVAELLHCYPTLHPATHLVPLMQRCQSDMEGAGLGQAGGEPSPLLPIIDGLMKAGVRGDAQGAMAIFSRCNSPWLLAHIPPLLQSTPQGAKALQAELPELGTTQVEECLLDYAMGLMGNKTTWTVATEVLAFCPRQGKSALEALLANLPVEEEDNEVMAHAALHLCRRHRLRASSTDICRRVAMQHWRQGRTAAALLWAGRAGDAERAEAFAAPLVQAIEQELSSSSSSSSQSDHSQPGSLAEQLADLLPILESLDDISPASPPSTAGLDHGSAHQHFPHPSYQDSQPSNIASCREYLNLSSAMRDAGHDSFPSSSPSTADNASHHLDRGACPVRLRLPILAAAIPLLEAQPPVMQHAELHALLAALEDAEEEKGCFGSAELAPSSWDASRCSTKLKAVRLAFSHSLTCSFVAEASSNTQVNDTAL